MSKGFSLIEIMLVLFIVGLLMAISVPYYSQHVVQQNRLVAASSLLKLSSALERYYLENNSYAGATLANLGFAASVANNQYLVGMVNAGADGFLISARPVNRQARDTVCATLSLNAVGEKSISGSGSVAECW
ncbi:MAG: type IV pilin protein [Pseudomonadota bacterium]